LFAGRVATEEKHIGRDAEQRAQEEQIDHVLKKLEIKRDSHTIGRQVGLSLTFTTKMNTRPGCTAWVLRVDNLLS
jgi:hypothetical protein